MSIEVATKDEIDMLVSQIQTFIKVFEALCNKLPELKVVTINDICKIEGKTKSFFSTHKYYLPRFGVSAYEGYTKWDWDEYVQWSLRPIEERKAEYIAMTHKKNQRR